MKLLLYPTLFLLTLQAYSQTENTRLVNDAPVYKSNELTKNPEYVGGASQFYKFVAKNFHIPDGDVSGKIIVEFIIETDGSLSNFKVTQDIGYGTDLEIIRVLRKSEKWQPAEKDGKPVRSSYRIPVTIAHAE